MHSFQFIKQTKGKALDKVPASRLLHDDWYASVKRDGHYVQIHKVGQEVAFFTSGGKRFYMQRIADALLAHFKQVDLIIECEYNYNCKGKLGDRKTSAKLTTYRTKFSKGIMTAGSYSDLLVLTDILQFGNAIDGSTTFSSRVGLYPHFKNIIHVQPNLLMSLESAKKYARRQAKNGWEGIYLRHHSHLLRAGKRVNDAIKIKVRPTADLLCYGITAGKGKYEGMIGSLLLKDSNGRNVSCSPGDDANRSMPYSYFTNKIIEVEYEQVTESSYIQPTFVGIRKDKTAQYSKYGSIEGLLG